MLLDMLLAGAPFVVVVPAVTALLTSPVGYASPRRLQKRLYRTLLLVEKLPPDLPGSAQLVADIERQTLHVGYLAQYPQRGREVLALALIGGSLIGTVVAYYVLLWTGAAWLSLLVGLALVAIASVSFHRALVNFARNDTLVRELFARFGAPQHLRRPPSALLVRAPARTVDALLQRAPTVEAVNAVLAQPHSPLDWRQEVGHLTHRGRAAAAAAYDRLPRRLPRRLFDPLVTLRLAYLDDRERHRIAAAERAGDVYKAAWLATYYRTERTRLSPHYRDR